MSSPPRNQASRWGVWSVSCPCKVPYRSVLLTGFSVEQLEALMGKKIPLGEMGFRCLGDFLFELRDMLEVYHFPQEDPSQRRTRLFLFVSHIS